LSSLIDINNNNKDNITIVILSSKIQARGAKIKIIKQGRH